MRRAAPIRFRTVISHISPLAVAAGLLVASCSGSGDGGTGGTTTRPGPSAEDRREAVSLAVDYLAQRMDQLDPPSLMILGYLGQNWDLPGLDGAPELALQTIDGHEHYGAHPLRRLVDPLHTAQAEDIAAIDDPSEHLMSLALWCREFGLGPDFADTVGAAVAAGGYEATHALLSIVWATDLGCDDDPVVDERTAAIDAIEQELARADVVTDLSFEQTAFLADFGAPEKVPSDAVDDIIAAQLADGGWGEAPGDESGWHPTALALWALLALDDDGAGQSMLAALR